MFKCDGCGCCCENLHRNEIMLEMHNGNGVCYFFNADSRQCSIYDSRPLICRVDDFFNSTLMSNMSVTDYYQANAHYCELMKAQKTFTTT